MNRLSIQKRAQIVGMMVEGVSLRAISRMTGASKNTLAKLLVDVGTGCAEYHDKHVRNLPCKRVQVDEIWSFVGMKQRNVPEELKGEFGVGDVYTWTALCADTKIIAGYRVDRRDDEAAYSFISDLAARLSNHIQLSSDGHHAYLQAVERVFGGEVDYAMLMKVYGHFPGRDDQRRYSPPECIGSEKRRIAGNPDVKHISTSFVERQNFSMRMGIRRFTRLTNAFSKKVENHAHAVAIYFMHYNYGRIHQTLRVTPAMEAGIADHVWSLEEIAGLADQTEKSAIAHEN